MPETSLDPQFVLELAEARRRDLMQAADASRLARQVTTQQETWRERVLFRIGDVLITVGMRLKARRTAGARHPFASISR